MTYWVTLTEAAASNLEQVILKLGSRALHLREGYERDANLNVVGKRLSNRVSNGQPTTNWDIPRETVDGTWAILSPTNDTRYAETYRDFPAVLAIGWGLDPTTVNWASVVTAANAAGASLNSLTFDPTVEVEMPGVAWVAGAASVLGIIYTERESVVFQ